MLLGILFLIWWWRRLAPQRAALHELANLQVEAGDPVHQAATVNRLLKRYALICWPGREIAALTGEPWLAFLDRHGGKGAFAQGPGRLLMVRPYCPPRQTVAASQDQASALVSLARRWIKANRPRGRQ
jgi:hypothetical protein